MQESQRHYWAFCANPRVYNVEQAVSELREDDGIVRRGDVRAGDRAIIWKAKGNQQDRGIVALAEILTDPAPGVPDRDYWVDQLTANEVRHARDHYPKVALFTLSRIQVDPTSIEKPQAGEMQILEPWNIDEGTLSPLAFTYNLPEKNA